MVRLRRGRVLRVTGERPGAVELEIHLEGAEAAALAYPDLTGPVAPGDQVVVNSTAVELGLGTGGVHLVVVVEGVRLHDATPEGRVMKARYTPLQTAVRSVEETHGAALEGVDLGGMPVVSAPLHSMIAPVAAGAKAAGVGRGVYVMTDGAAV